jgi:hypothetical protein
LKKRRSPPGAQQKLLTSAAASTLPATAWIYPPAQNVKVFWFFSSEKNILPFHRRHEIAPIKISAQRILLRPNE